MGLNEIDINAIVLQNKIRDKESAFYELVAYRSPTLRIRLSASNIVLLPLPLGTNILPITDFNNFYSEYQSQIKDYFMGFPLSIAAIANNRFTIECRVGLFSKEMEYLQVNFNYELASEMMEEDDTPYFYDSESQEF